MSSGYDTERELPDQRWDENIRSEYGSNFIFLGIAIVLFVAFVIFIMLLIKFFENLFRVERRPLQAPAMETKRPNSVKLVWNTLWDQPLPPGNFRSQAYGMHSTSTRRLTDSEHTSLYMTEH